MKKGELEARILILVTLALVAFGIVMVYSATSASAAVGGSNPNYYLERQGIYAVLGIALMVIAQRWDYRRLAALAPVARSHLARVAAGRARDRACDQRRAPLDLARPGRLPAVGVREARAGGVGGGLSRPPSGAADDARAGATDRRARRPLCRAADRRAGPRDRDRADGDARRDAAHRRHACARARCRAHDRGRPRHGGDLVRAVPPRALLRVPASVARPARASATRSCRR